MLRPDKFHIHYICLITNKKTHHFVNMESQPEIHETANPYASGSRQNQMRLLIKRHSDN